MKTMLAPTVLMWCLCSVATGVLGAGQLTLLSANVDGSGSRIVLGGANLSGVSAVWLGRSPLSLVAVGSEEVQAAIPQGTKPGTYLLLVSSGTDSAQNDEMWFTLSSPSCAPLVAAAAPTFGAIPMADVDPAANPAYQSVHLGVDNFTANSDGGRLDFGAANGVSTGYGLSVSRFPWTDSGGTYIDSAFAIGMFPTVTGNPTLGITMESQFRQSGTSPFQSEFIENWTSPDGRFRRRPRQWYAQFDTGLIQHLISGRVEYYSSTGDQRIVINETGALQFLSGDKQIYMGGATIIASNGADVSLNFAAKNYGAFNFKNGAGNMLQLATIPGGYQSNGYLQVRPAWFQGYQRELGFTAAGTATDIPIYFTSKGSGDIGMRTGGAAMQVDILHTPLATRYLTLTGATSAGDPQIGTNGGNVAFARPVTTPDPTSGQGPAWRLGAIKPGSVALDSSNYVEVMIGGQLVKLLKAQ